MRVFVVVPCRDEADNLSKTCASLLASAAQATPSVTLVLVDNASEDRTWEKMQAARDAATPGVVELGQEPVPGYVPARLRGIDVARERAEQERLAADDVLILQADADTIYDVGYVPAMAAAARRSGRGRLLQGQSVPPPASVDLCAAFRALEHTVDEPFLDALDPADDVIVDDKVAGYFLSDYLRWGGLTRAFHELGDEIFAETSRMFFAARLRGAALEPVEEALAWTSQRKIVEDPPLAFATAGFPRERGWKSAWRARYRGPRDLAAFAPEVDQTAIKLAIDTRRRHLTAMFVVLPQLVASLSERPSAAARPPEGRPSLDEAVKRPGSAFEWAFAVAREGR